MAAAIDLRAQDLTPGGRLTPLAPARPVLLGAAPAYLATYAIEDRDLRRSFLATALMPVDGATLHWRLTTPGPMANLDEILLHVLSGVRAGAR